MGFSADDLLFRDHLETMKMEMIAGNILGKSGIRQEDSERKIIVVDEPGWNIDYSTMSACTFGLLFLMFMVEGWILYFPS
jgi:hypothetical protein